MNILLIEDNELIIKGLLYLLEQHQFKVDFAKSLDCAKNVINKTYDLIILDLALPDGDGLDFYKQFINKKIPTLVLSAKDEEEKIVATLDAGVDDYVIKPFRSRELLSRINKILNRNLRPTIIDYENIRFDLASSIVYVNKQEISLTALELKILFLLLENHNQIVTRDLIIDRIWDVSGKFVNDNTLTVYIKRIREKLQNENIIKTVKGIGYRVDLWKRRLSE